VSRGFLNEKNFLNSEGGEKGLTPCLSPGGKKRISPKKIPRKGTKGFWIGERKTPSAEKPGGTTKIMVEGGGGGGKDSRLTRPLARKVCVPPKERQRAGRSTGHEGPARI